MADAIYSSALPQCPNHETETYNIMTLSQAVTELIRSKTQLNRRPLYIRSLRQYLSAFVRGREEMPISDVNESHIESWFLDRSEAPSSRASNLGRLSALFSHAYRKRWVGENPCDRVERVSIDSKVPQILAVDQCAQLLWYCQRSKPHALAYVALALFAGVRPLELSRIRWDSIDLDSRKVFVAPEASKVRTRRIVHLEPAAVEWLTLAKEKRATLPVLTSTRRRYVHCFRALLDMRHWPQDVFRHTCASHWLAARRDAGYVALELGNSQYILLRHYREIVEEEDAKKFWDIKPL